MKIMVQTPLKNREIQELFDGRQVNGMAFTFVGKQGIGLVFDTDSEDAEAACAVVKQTIKATDWGKVLYFSVTRSM